MNRMLVGVGLLVVALLPVHGYAEDAVEAARDALDGRIDFPWYDAQSDGLRRVDVEPPTSSADNRASRWEAQPSAPTTPSSFAWVDIILAIVRVLGWILLIALIVAVVWWLIWAFMQGESRGVRRSDEDVDEDELARERQLIENLPFDLKRPQSNLLGEARRHYESGNYREAIIYLYSYQLVQLDKHHVIRLPLGHPTRLSLLESTPPPLLRQLLEGSMMLFEDAFFGNYRIDRESFERCWHRLDEFEGHLESMLEAAV